MLFARIKIWAIALTGAIFALAAIFKFGERSGKQAAKFEETNRRLKSTKEMKAIKHDIESQDDPHLTSILERRVRKD